MTTILKAENPVDEVIAEVRATKERLAAKQGFNLHRIVSQIRQDQLKSKIRVVNRRTEHSKVR